MNFSLAIPSFIARQRFFNGFDVRCFVPPNQQPGSEFPPGSPAPLLPDFTDRRTWARLAAVLEKQYDAGPGAASLLQSILGATAVLTTVENSSSLIPGTIFAKAPHYQLIVISGTSNDDQLYAQVIYSVLPPIPFGPYSTSAFWETAATAVHVRLMAQGLDSTLPVYLVGHSYGGVLASILAAKYRLGQPGRRIELLTYGSPKPGGQDLADLLATTNNRHFANRGDPAPVMPPDVDDLVGMVTLIGPLLFLAWSRWVIPRNQTIIEEDGTLLDSQESTLNFSDLFAAVGLALLSLPQPFVQAHQAGEYRSRLDL